jgi:amino acid transporter
VSYILADLDVLVLRRRFPKAPRAFKVPGGPVVPIVGIVGTVFMIANISSDPAEAQMVWLVSLVTLAVLGVLSLFWIRRKMHMAPLKPVPIPQVLAMENDLYYTIRHRRGIWR